MTTTLEERLYMGTRAKELLENEAFIAAFEDIEKEIIESWKATPARDAEGREKLWTYLTLLKKVRTQLQTTLETGKLAQLELQHQQSIRDKVRDWTGL